MVGVRGLEPPASRSQSAHSSQLSYTPICINKNDFLFALLIVYNKKGIVKLIFMQRLYGDILGTMIINMATDLPMALVKDLVVDTDRGVVIAVYVNKSKNLIIRCDDFNEWGMFVGVPDRDVIVHAEDVLRVNSIINKGIPFIGHKVVTESGKNLGNITDYLVDTETNSIIKIYVDKTFLNLISLERRIIHVSEIKIVNKKAVVVRDDFEIVADKSPGTAMSGVA